MIRCALPENGLKSRIITTTRINDVAEHIGGCYKLKPLPHKSSKILFYGKIFGSEENCPKQFFDVSENIVKKCGGIPLAIVTTSSLLANMSRNINEWHDVCDSIGSGLGSNPSMDNMRKILLLSYYDLTPQLKTCLLYLSIFPEDYVIGKCRLIYRWIAEGFIQQGNVRQSLHEIANSYFNELLNRSLILPAGMDQDDMSPLSCQVHDMVLDVICSLSRVESFATTISGDYKQSTSSETKVRRLSVHSTTRPTMNLSKLRSLTISDSSIINSVTPLSCYHLLRVLDLEDCNLSGQSSIEFVSKLFHLRYLGLAGTEYAGEIPRQIGRLQFLQTLDIDKTGIKELPSSVLELRQLMYLRAGWSTRLPNGLRNLSSLECLGLCIDSAHTAEELGHLTELRVLGVGLIKDKEGRWDESIPKVLVESLAKLHKIENLAVVSENVEVGLEGSVDSLHNLSILGISGTSWLPTWIDPASFLHLSQLYIKVGQIRSADFHVLGMLHVLRWLKVKVVSTKQGFERVSISADAFLCVTWCKFSGFSLVPSMFPPGAMPKLQHFKFHIRQEDFCWNELNFEDLHLGHLPSLQTVWVRIYGEEEVDQEAVTKVKEALMQEALAHHNHPVLFVRVG